MSLFNLRIRGRLYGGFGALVLFGLGMAGFAVWKLTEIRDDVSVMNAQSASAMRSMEISAELQALRRAMLRYTFDQDEASFDEAGKLLTQVGGVLEETIRASSEERRGVYREVEKTVNDLKSKRVDLGNTVKEMVDSRKALLAEGEKLQADLKKLVLSTRSSPFAQGATTLQSETLLVQMANWRFFAGRDQDNVTLFA
ncbi:MAG: methyl-accepting chemotaxis protein, partial [Pseudomonadota bacterium]